jgi:hypothetical protein
MPKEVKSEGGKTFAYGTRDDGQSFVMNGYPEESKESLSTRFDSFLDPLCVCAICLDANVCVKGCVVHPHIGLWEVKS